jgi:hypothetical protein
VATSAPELVQPLLARLFEVDFAKSHELREPLETHWTDGLAEAVLNQF